mmetsp:Transcript_37254/g.118678  ORF Transcript_37254/g.118678 Transcript_37254/m.118678 type:complete len:261 (+) Transcript_37254:309-1091(+)
MSMSSMDRAFSRISASSCSLHWCSSARACRAAADSAAIIRWASATLMSVTPSPSTSTASSYALVSTVAWTARSRARIFLFSSAIRALSSALRRTRSCMASLRALRNSFSATFGSFPLRSDLSSAFSRRIRSDSAAFNRAMCSAYFSLSSSVASGPNGPSCRRTARLGRALGFLPAQSSTAALYTPLNSSKLSSPLPSTSYDRKTLAANSMRSLFSRLARPRSSSTGRISSMSMLPLRLSSHLSKTSRSFFSRSSAMRIAS